MSNAHIIDGKKIATDIRAWVKDQVSTIEKNNTITPGLAVMLVGEDPASEIYVRNKGKQSKEVGMNSWEYRFPADTSETELKNKVRALNEDESVDGILIQLPFPSSSKVSERSVIGCIDPNKDVDGLHTVNAGRLVTNENGLFPATPTGCLILAKKFTDTLAGKRGLVIGRSNLVGKPISTMLVQENCTVTIAHSKTKELANECRKADIIVAALGQPEFVRGDWVKEGAIIIDVGINRIKQPNTSKTKLVGDVAFHEAVEVAKAITPVPGGVGPMTIACLLLNTLKAACMRRGIIPPTLN